MVLPFFEKEITMALTVDEQRGIQTSIANFMYKALARAVAANSSGVITQAGAKTAIQNELSAWKTAASAPAVTLPQSW